MTMTDTILTRAVAISSAQPRDAYEIAESILRAMTSGKTSTSKARIIIGQLDKAHTDDQERIVAAIESLIAPGGDAQGLTTTPGE